MPLGAANHVNRIRFFRWEINVPFSRLEEGRANQSCARTSATPSQHREQDLHLQFSGPREHGVRENVIFTDAASTAKAERPGLDAPPRGTAGSRRPTGGGWPLFSAPPCATPLRSSMSSEVTASASGQPATAPTLRPRFLTLFHTDCPQRYPKARGGVPFPLARRGKEEASASNAQDL